MNDISYIKLTLGIVSEFKITGSYQHLRVGNTTVISCSVPLLANSIITWLAQDGSVVNNSGVLILQSVDYSINGSVFTCSVNSPQLYTPGKENIIVTVQS